MKHLGLRKTAPVVPEYTAPRQPDLLLRIDSLALNLVLAELRVGQICGSTPQSVQPLVRGVLGGGVEVGRGDSDVDNVNGSAVGDVCIRIPMGTVARS